MHQVIVSVIYDFASYSELRNLDDCDDIWIKHHADLIRPIDDRSIQIITIFDRFGLYTLCMTIP